ncbi:hypothetical protein [Roseomonas xinghualingensis]|uniref:hypothetical protein n=1 Tax=Roseomonas xinghualingensis TaxID=2986475 RepID=UPI0021F1AFC7|nr:hypothetical protein [Roseomonas sp. SXEYE001]MCV4209029.1 hypothetical protein [Roseomonas sp. SXEYE001]
MTPALVLRLTVDPVLAWMAGMGVRSDDRARVLLLAIAGQESGFRHRRQVPVAHAMGLWQFERGGGVAGVLRHAASRPHALTACQALLVPATPEAVHPALEFNDDLACAFARLLLFTDPKALPPMDEPYAGWEYYLRCWRPGKPHPGTWAGHWRNAKEALTMAGAVK